MGQLDYIKFKVPIADTEFKLAQNILGYLAIEPGEKTSCNLQHIIESTMILKCTTTIRFNKNMHCLFFLALKINMHLNPHIYFSNMIIRLLRL